ncbi:hypothetical protein ACQP3C_31000, partial [Escherichia coli]
GRQISVSSRPAWSTEQVPGQVPKQYRETLSEKQKPNQTKTNQTKTNKKSYSRTKWILFQEQKSSLTMCKP